MIRFFSSAILLLAEQSAAAYLMNADLTGHAAAAWELPAASAAESRHHIKDEKASSCN